jgi:hypothetical protein
MDELAIRTMQMFGSGQSRSPQFMKRLVHGVEWFGRTGKQAELDEVMERIRDWPARTKARI